MAIVTNPIEANRQKRNNEPMTTLQSTTSHTYEEIDEALLARLEAEHAWIVAPIYRASTAVKEMPFFAWLRGMKSLREIKPVAVQLYHHSATFPKVMGLMLGSTPMSENFMMPFYGKHAFGEADHHQMLMRWMLRHGVLGSADELEVSMGGGKRGDPVKSALHAQISSPAALPGSCAWAGR